MSPELEIRLTNTLTKKKEVLKTLEPGKLRMYSCGPTVYGLIHIGNLRAALVADLFYRYFKNVGLDVTYVRNYTDVDDKIIARANEEGISTEEVTKKYTQEVEKDYAVAGLLEPTHKTKATEHIPQMIKMIEEIIAKGQAYEVEGEVLFDIQSFKGYGKLSGKEIDDLIAGVRIEVDRRKRNPLDFALWKPAKPGEPSWDSPWGKGRPGWHIECSVMAQEWMGPQIDIHHGGQDLIFPHHENEIAQSEAASGKAPFARYWLHNAFVTLSKQKMAKSAGNVFNARDFLTQYGGEFARYLFLSVHYRQPLDFSEAAIEKTLTSLERIYEAKREAQSLQSLKRALPDHVAEAAWGSFVASCESTRKKIAEEFANDLNVAGALGHLFTLIREFNKTLAVPKAKATPAAILAGQQLIEILERDFAQVVGIGRLEASKALADWERIRGMRLKETGVDRPSEEEIEKLIQDRKDARAAKDFGRADQIRDELDQRGVELKDGPQGTSWKFK